MVAQLCSVGGWGQLDCTYKVASQPLILNSNPYDLPINIQKLIYVSARSHQKLLGPMVNNQWFPCAEYGRLTDDNFLAFVEQFAQDSVGIAMSMRSKG